MGYKTPFAYWFSATFLLLFLLHPLHSLHIKIKASHDDNFTFTLSFLFPKYIANTQTLYYISAYNYLGYLMNLFRNISSTAARALALELSSRRRAKSSQLPHPTLTTRLLRVHPPTWPIPTQTHCERQPQRIKPSLTYIGSTAYISVLCETDVRKNLTQLKQDILEKKKSSKSSLHLQTESSEKAKGKCYSSMIEHSTAWLWAL